MQTPPIFLSPHHGDVCFSLSVAARSGGGHLINIFTQVEHVEIPLPTFRDRQEKVRYVTALRAEEDRQFAGACRLERHDLGLEEPSLLAIDSRDFSNLRREAERVGAALTDLLSRLSAGGTPDKPTLYCPMGIGGHRNHASVLLAVLAALPRLHARYRLCFYEDLCDASDPAVRNQGLGQFLDLLGVRRLTRRAVPLDSEALAAKMRLVGLYGSRHAGVPDPGKFTCAAPEPAGPHEAFWELAPVEDTAWLWQAPGPRWG